MLCEEVTQSRKISTLAAACLEGKAIKMKGVKVVVEYVLTTNPSL